MDSQSISEQLNVSKRTVDKPRSNFIQKLEISGGNNSLFMYAMEHRSALEKI